MWTRVIIWYEYRKYWGERLERALISSNIINSSNTSRIRINRAIDRIITKGRKNRAIAWKKDIYKFGAIKVKDEQLIIRSSQKLRKSCKE